MSMHSYRFLTRVISPFIPLWLTFRRWKGKEDANRINERYGIAPRARPEGLLVWVHAASIGEANSVVPMLLKIREKFPHIHLLLTTGTVTSALMMQKRLPTAIIHQYAPIDTPQAVDRFIRHWKPDFAFWVESEFWPNMIAATNDFGSLMGVINARMSENTFRSWQKHPAMIKQMLSCFDLVFAQSDEDGRRLRALGAKEPLNFGNIKYDAPPLGCNENALLTLKNALGKRPVWLAASTHPGEETFVAQIHGLLATTRPNLLTIIVPRHTSRGHVIAQELQKYGKVILRSKGESLSPDTAFYVADTLGELGLFYRLCDIVFMGGSLVPHGGQNPLEPARLSCVVLAGTHTQNFANIYAEMEQAGAVLRVQNASNLAAHIDRIMNDAKARSDTQDNTRKWLKDKGGATERILALLAPALEQKHRP